MKLKSKVFFSVGVIGSAVAVCLSLLDEIALAKIEIAKGFTVTAHTGCEGTKDNSIDAITVGFGYGADIVEFDLLFDKNGKAVMSHNEPTGDVNSVDDAFKLISGYKGLRVNVDVKRPDDLKQVVELAEKYGIKDRIFYTGITSDFVDAVKNSTPEITYYLNRDIDAAKINNDEYIAQLIKEVKSLGACGLNIHHKGCSEKLVEAFHKEGLLVSVWTANKKNDMIKALSMQCDNITTRKPAELKKLVEKTENIYSFKM